MNTTLPPSRDLPAGRHHELRAAVLAQVGGGPARRWLAPLATTAAALAAIGLVVWVAPWSGPGGAPVATRPASADPSLTVSTGAPAVVGVTPADVTAIERGCAASAGVPGPLTLDQVLTDEAGRIALLHNDSQVFDCVLDGPAMPYNSGFMSLAPFEPPITADGRSASAGGDTPGNKPEYAGTHGTETVNGHISPEVARVTVTQGADTVEAQLANGTFLARIVHPADWASPENLPAPLIRAYDKNGTLLAEISS